MWENADWLTWQDKHSLGFEVMCFKIILEYAICIQRTFTLELVSFCGSHSDITWITLERETAFLLTVSGLYRAGSDGTLLVSEVLHAMSPLSSHKSDYVTSEDKFTFNFMSGCNLPCKYLFVQSLPMLPNIVFLFPDVLPSASICCLLS